MRATFDVSTVNAATARWLRKRNPGWSAERIERQILRTYVVDRHPDWDASQIEHEVNRQLNGEEPEDETDGGKAAQILRTSLCTRS